MAGDASGDRHDAPDPVADDPHEGEVPNDRLLGLARELQEACLARGATVAVAESCTGGLVTAALTAHAGSSGYLLGGIVSYADAAKQELLGVPAGVLESHGAVSAQTARAMATGARTRFGATIAASVTGIAGPGGATPDKPIGLTYVGVADVAGADVRRVVWTGDRQANRRDSAILVVELLLERIRMGRSEADDAADANGAADAKDRPDVTSGTDATGPVAATA